VSKREEVTLTNSMKRRLYYNAADYLEISLETSIEMGLHDLLDALLQWNVAMEVLDAVEESA
jgi:hypothetical protein